MKETTIVMKKHITIEAFKRVVEIEKQISEAVQLFGYNLEKHRLTIKLCVFQRYFGLWDIRRKTFVD